MWSSWSSRIGPQKTGKYGLLRRLKNWVRICRITRVLQECEVKMCGPSGLSSSVILSSAFSSLVLPSTWQGFPLHSWLYNLSLSLSQSLTLSCMWTLRRVCTCVCACVCMHTCMCACFIPLCAACKPVIRGAFWGDLSCYCSSPVAVCQIYEAIWPTNKTFVHNCARGGGIPFTHPSLSHQSLQSNFRLCYMYIVCMLLL